MTKKKVNKGKKKQELNINLNKKIILGIVIVILLAIAIYLVLNIKPNVAAQGDTVLVDYYGTLDNGDVFDTNIESAAKAAGTYLPGKSYSALEITIGEGRFIKGFEDALYGMTEGETKTVEIPAAQAYGEYDPRKIAVFPLEGVPNRDEVKEGYIVRDGKGLSFTVVEVNSTHAFIDANHPLAGEKLTFEITLIKLK